VRASSDLGAIHQNLAIYGAPDNAHRSPETLNGCVILYIDDPDFIAGRINNIIGHQVSFLHKSIAGQISEFDGFSRPQHKLAFRIEYAVLFLISLGSCDCQ
jgi:hypothetical protein